MNAHKNVIATTLLTFAFVGLIFVGFICVGSALAQSILPAPGNDEARAPRPERARGIPVALAVQAAQTANASCLSQGNKVTTLIVDSQAVPIAMISSDGAATITQRIASGKAVTAVRMKMTSGDAATKAKDDKAFSDKLTNDTAMGPPRAGALPIMIAGEVVGAIAVSGSPTGAADEVCARAGLAAIQDRLK